MDDILARYAVIVHPKQPFVDWINTLPEVKGKGTVTVEEADTDPMVFLVPDEGNLATALEYIYDDIYKEIFWHMFFEWSQDESTHPQERTLEMFKAWFDIELSSNVYDLVDDDEECDDEGE
jgi:hypothetical protein